MKRWAVTIPLAFSVVLGLHTATAAQQGPPATTHNGQNTTLRGFVITLALGDLQGPPSRPLRWTPPPPTVSLTPAETKALADLKGFLPYKTYRPLDTAWVIGQSVPHLFLRGEDGQKHEFAMGSTQLNPSYLSVDFLRLWDVQPADEKQAATLLIDTSFKIEVGETVVVGTSRLDGGRALILLVTAAARQVSDSQSNPATTPF